VVVIVRSDESSKPESESDSESEGASLRAGVVVERRQDCWIEMADSEALLYPKDPRG